MTTLNLILVRDDCRTLLERALVHKTLFMFGEDGNGQYGRSEYPVYSEVSKIEISLSADDDDAPSDIHGVVRIYMPDYNVHDHGFAVTDTNLRISLNMRLADVGIDASALDWAHLSVQGDDYVTMSIDVGTLLKWS